MTPGLGLLLHDASRAVRKKFEERSAAFGLSSGQWRMMVNVCKMGSATQTRLADLLEIEPISVSRLLDRMEEQGWVTRENDPADRRVKLIKPTPKALEAFNHVKSIADEVYANALIGLSVEQCQGLVAGLSAIVTNLSKADIIGEKVSA
ncbi:MAG: MarR family winged helix-turn-helix transcriptional regulator [Paracoccaceae bacterium]